MPHLPNWQEMGTPVVGGSAKDPTEVYDRTYGRYADNQGKNVTPGPKPATQPTPFALG